MQRIGVFVCHCGTNIAATVDVKAVAEALGHEPGVVISREYQYMCSESGQNLVKDAIKEHNLSGVVICSCSPRMHENTFRKAAAAAGLNPYLVEIANIREQCSWIHKDIATATEKAVILGRAAIAKVHLNAPLTAGESPVVKRALVIGGGIAGIQTALDIAEAGFEVDIVEKNRLSAVKWLRSIKLSRLLTVPLVFSHLKWLNAHRTKRYIFTLSVKLQMSRDLSETSALR